MDTGTVDIEVDGDSGTSEVDSGPSTWEERFDLVIPSDGAVPIELGLDEGGWQEMLERWVEQSVKVEKTATIAAGPRTHPAVGVKLERAN